MVAPLVTDPLRANSNPLKLYGNRPQHSDTQIGANSASVFTRYNILTLMCDCIIVLIVLVSPPIGSQDFYLLDIIF